MKINIVHHRFFYGLQITFRFQFVSKLILFRPITAINFTKIFPMQPVKRSQAVRIGYSLSAAAAVTSGVIQSSCLGPTLFNIFLDRLLNDIDIPAGAYADDLKFTANLVHHSYIKIQSNINRVNDWWPWSCRCPLKNVSFFITV